MKSARILNRISYLFLIAVYVFTGWVLHVMGLCYRFVFNNVLPGKPLPEATEVILSYGTSGASLAVNIVAGLAWAGLLLYLDLKSEKGRAFIPTLLTLAYIALVVQLAVSLEVSTLPFFYLTYGMTDLRSH